MGKYKAVHLVLAAFTGGMLLLGGLLSPVPAWASVTVSALTTPNITNSFTGDLGTIQIAGLLVNPGQSDTFVATMPPGIVLQPWKGGSIDAYVSVPLYNPDSSTQNAFWVGPNNGNSVIKDAYGSNADITSNMISFTITTPGSAPSGVTGSLLINVPVASAQEVPSGPVVISLSDSDGLIPRNTAAGGVLVSGPSLAVQATSLPAAAVGLNYNAAIAASGGTPPYTFSVSSGQCPPGLSLSATEGTLTGTPVTAGSYNFTVSVKDFSGAVVSQYYGLTVNAAPAPAPVPAPAPRQPVFSDIAGSWAQSYILQLAKTGVVSGYPDGTFRPDGTVTRVEFAKMLLLTMGQKPSQDVSVLAGFSDYATYAPWELPWLAAAVQSHILSGYPDGTLRPDKTVTWLEAAVIMGKTVGETVVRQPTFPGAAAVPGWARPYVAKDLAQTWAEGLLSGVTQTFNPDQPLTRAEAAAALGAYVGL